MYNTGQKIDGLKHASVILSNRFDKLLSECGSNHTKLNSEFEELKKWVEESIYTLVQKIGNCESQINAQNKTIIEALKKTSDLFIEKEEFYPVVDEIQRELKSFHEKSQSNFDYFNFAVEQARSQANQNIEDLKIKIDLKPDDFDPIKSEINECLRSWMNEFVGLSQEIAILKQALAYDQKKFENIYTQLDRLKAGKE